METNENLKSETTSFSLKKIENQKNYVIDKDNIISFKYPTFESNERILTDDYKGERFNLAKKFKKTQIFGLKKDHNSNSDNYLNKKIQTKQKNDSILIKKQDIRTVRIFIKFQKIIYFFRSKYTINQRN